jgi:hypothetical protein
MNFQGIGQVWAWQCGYGASAAALIIPTSNDSSIIFQRARFKPPPSSIETIGSLGHSLMEFLVLLASGNGKP